MRRMVLALAVVIGVATLGLGTAAATRTVKIASAISIADKGLTFHGKVSSPNGACRAHRKVVLFRTPSQRLGSTHTTSTGHWKITVSGFAGVSLGRFYARVTRRSEGTAGTIFVCKAAKSKTIKFHQ